MSLSNSRLAYTDCYEFLDAAIADPQGVRMKLPYNQAVHFRMRCNHARSIDRRENTLTYPEDHPLYGRSEYDRVRINLIQRIENGAHVGYVYATPWAIEGKIENLSDLGHDHILDQPPPVLEIEDLTQRLLPPPPKNLRRF